MTKVFTNSSERRDFFGSALRPGSMNPCDVHIAVAFLTRAEDLLELATNSYRIRLVVRLGYPTSPAALGKLLGTPGIQLRFQSSRAFHPKLYLFTGRTAFVGSSNLTDAAMMTNQEINIEVPADDPRFATLESAFSEYWGQSDVLTEEKIAEYERLLKEAKEARATVASCDDRCAKLGSSIVRNISRGTKQKNKKDLYVDSFRANYQEFLSAFSELRGIYEEAGRRRPAMANLPLHIEIDAFLGWLPEEHYHADDARNATPRYGDDLRQNALHWIDAWMNSAWKWGDEHIPEDGEKIRRLLATPALIDASDYDTLLEALLCEHSFRGRYRYFKGGRTAHLAAFKDSNQLDAVKKTFKHLLFGKSDPVERIADAIYGEHQLGEFGPSGVRELVGWTSDGSLPISNARTMRSLRWLGWTVPLFADS